MNQFINIFVLCHDNLHELQLCIKSLTKRTKYPHRIVIVDNASTNKELLNYLEKIKANSSNIELVKNKWNLWAIGFNNALKKYLSDSDSYFVATDCDIVVPIVRNGLCWLERLVNEMEDNIPIGKLGIALDLGFIKHRQQFQKTFEKELKFSLNPKIGSNVIAPVDTSLAIYRTNYFMMCKPRFYPGHAVLGRPEYYCCRTTQNFVAKHIGWRSYLNSNIPEKYNKSKFFCFLFIGAYLDPIFLKKLPNYYSSLYKIIRPLVRAAWSINVFRIQTLWFFKSSPFKLNSIQFKFKDPKNQR